MGVNFRYALPVGRGKRFAGGRHPAPYKIIGDWNLDGRTRWSGGAPFTVTSGRLTAGSLVTATADIRNMRGGALKKHVGMFRTPNGVLG